jgi:hypothetical protein
VHNFLSSAEKQLPTTNLLPNPLPPLKEQIKINLKETGEEPHCDEPKSLPMGHWQICGNPHLF